jgi:hypothetical protein
MTLGPLRFYFEIIYRRSLVFVACPKTASGKRTSVESEVATWIYCKLPIPAEQEKQTPFPKRHHDTALRHR